MAASTVQVRELMGPNQFAKRREMFDKYDSVFTPEDSVQQRYSENSYGKPVSSSNQGNSGTFQRNDSYSSFREPRSSAPDYYHLRKWSDAQNSDLGEGVVVREVYYGSQPPRSHSSSDYSQNLRRSRLSKLRAEFLASNLHSPEDLNKPFQRFGTRASLPAQRSEQYKRTQHIYKFPFAEPYSTPPAVRKIHLDFGTPIKKNSISNENNDSIVVSGDIQLEADPKSEDNLEVSVTDASLVSSDRSSISNSATTPDKNHFRERFEKLRNEYAPHVAPSNLLEKLPPTKPRVIDTIPKDLSRANSQVDYTDSLATKSSDDKTVETPEVGSSELPPVVENDAIDKQEIEINQPSPVNNVTPHSHQRSPSDITKDSVKPAQPQRRNTEDNTNQNMPFNKTKKRNIFQRLFLLKNKKEK